MDKEYWEKQLEAALSGKNYELIKSAVKNGANPTPHILYYILHDDCTDLLQYFLFSPELPNHCMIETENTDYTHNNLFVSSCSIGALNIIKFILKDPRLCGKFKKESYYKGFKSACFSGNVEAIDFLLNGPQTKEACKFEYNNFEIIKEQDRMTERFIPKTDFWEYVIMNLEFNLVKKIKEIIFHKRFVCQPFFQARELHESLKNDLQINNKDIRKTKI